MRNFSRFAGGYSAWDGPKRPHTSCSPGGGAPACFKGPERGPFRGPCGAVIWGARARPLIGRSGPLVKGGCVPCLCRG